VDLKKYFNLLVPEHFWARPNKLGEHLVTQASNNVWKNIDSVDDCWQQIAKFVFNVSNLLFSQVSTVQTDKQW